jgi:cystathionine beta-lyase/cystathionine gamma-synthase
MVDSVYGPARNFCDKVLTRCGVETTYYDPLLGEGVARLMRPNTKVVYVESPRSLTFEVQDVPRSRPLRTPAAPRPAAAPIRGGLGAIAIV